LNSENIEKSHFEQYTGLLIAAIYCFSANGRIRAVGNLTVLDACNLLRDGHVMSTFFKTVSSYGYQPVVIDNAITHPLLQLYLSLLRPIAAKNARNNKDSSSIPQSHQPLWLSFSGEPMSVLSLGYHLTTFFQLQSSYHITTNTLRGLVETHATALLRSGKISDNVRGSITAINGHSSQIMREHYLFEDRTSDVRNSRSMFSAAGDDLANGCTVSSSSHYSGSTETYASTPQLDYEQPTVYPLARSSPSTETYGLTPQMDYFDNSDEMETFDLRSVFADETGQRMISPLPPPCEVVVSSFSLSSNQSQATPPCWKDLHWGSDHPDCDKESQRAHWSDKEVEYIGNFCSKYMSEHPLSKTVAAKCAEHIKNDPGAVAIFHRNHIENNKKIRTGIDRWRKTLTTC
jgi:hypothetical protein